MSHASFLNEFNSLVEEYGVDLIARLIGVSPRGTFNWTAEKGQKKPRYETVQKVHELFLKQEAGVDLRKEEMNEAELFKKKYVASLERENERMGKDLTAKDMLIADLKSENRTLRKAQTEKTSPNYEIIIDEVNKKLESVDTNLDALRKTSIAADARQQAGQALLIAIHQGERQGRTVQELLAEWDTEAVKLMSKMQKDIQIGAGKKDKEKSIGRS